MCDFPNPPRDFHPSVTFERIVSLNERFSNPLICATCGTFGGDLLSDDLP